MAGEIDTTALIVAICVIIPALIAIGVCAIIYFAHRKKNRKLNYHTDDTSSYGYESSRERTPQDSYIIDFSRTHRYPPQRRQRQPPPVLEHSPPAYETTIVQTRKQNIPLYSSIRTLPTSAYIRRASPGITPSIHRAMPPSYAEIFLSPHTLPNA